MAQLRHKADEFKRLNVPVLLVSFSSRGYARVWLKETGAPFPLLLDRERNVYRAYGLERSMIRAWGPKSIWDHVKAFRAGKKWHGVHGDSTQLGGNFVVDASGVVRWAHRSRDPADRPSVESLISVLRGLNAP